MMARESLAAAEEAAYEAWEAERERECGRSIVYGPGHDPYGTECDREAGHDSEHEGPDPLIEGGRLRWSGGGTCAGDRLPVGGLRRVEARR